MTLSGADVLSKCHLLHGPIWWLYLQDSCLYFNKEKRKAGSIYGMKAEGRTIWGDGGTSKRWRQGWQDGSSVHGWIPSWRRLQQKSFYTPPAFSLGFSKEFDLILKSQPQSHFHRRQRHSLEFWEWPEFTGAQCVTSRQQIDGQIHLEMVGLHLQKVQMGWDAVGHRLCSECKGLRTVLCGHPSLSLQ